MRRIEAYRVKRRDNLGDPEYWNRRFEDIDLRLHRSEQAADVVEETAARVERAALDRIDNVVTPIVVETVERIQAIPRLFEATSISAVTVGTGTRTFEIEAGQRNTFAPLTAVVAHPIGDTARYLHGLVESYDAGTGELVVDVEIAVGAGTFNAWLVAAAPPPDTAASGAAIATLRDGVAEERDTLKKLSDDLDEHQHDIADVSGLQAALDGKAATVHQHPATDIADASAPGRDLLTAASVAAQLALLFPNGRMPKGYISPAFHVANNAGDAVNDLDFAGGTCRDQSDTVDIVVGAMTKQLDALFAAGNNGGLRDAGAIANGTWHLHAIWNNAAKVGDYVASTSLVPALPAGFTHYRRVASWLRESGTLVQLIQDGDTFRRKTRTDCAALTTLGDSDTTVTADVPTGLRLVLDVFVSTTGASGGTAGCVVHLFSADETSLGTPGSGKHTVAHTSNNGVRQAGFGKVITNTSAQFKLRSNAANTWVNASVWGWTDTRGRI